MGMLSGLFGGKKSAVPQLDNEAVGQGQSYLAQKALLDRQMQAQQGMLANEQAGNMANTINQSSVYGMDSGTIARAQAQNQRDNAMGNQGLAMGNQLAQAQGLVADAGRFDQNKLINQQSMFAAQQGKKDNKNKLLTAGLTAAGTAFGGPAGGAAGSVLGGLFG
jgi:hypothetical protein